ncbi:hypothetical protein [Formosa haliotis]|uniref:hypothetical protein n=1 Tax=Formosa haliotis TaxID=1555194 RepID=UPI0008258FFF|nr:hypothetical protein [Formosa haliotis]
MKKALIVLLCLSVFISCKNDTKSTSETTSTEHNEDSKVLKGEFVYYADAAVLQTTDQIYGVIINKKMHDLDTQAKAFKKEDTDMVFVEVKGLIKPKPEGQEGWPFQVEITDIINVSASKNQDEHTIKIKDTNN